MGSLYAQPGMWKIEHSRTQEQVIERDPLEFLSDSLEGAVERADGSLTSRPGAP